MSLDRLIETIYRVRVALSEQAYYRDQVESKVTGIGRTVVDHIIKIVRYDSRWTSKHIEDMDSLITSDLLFIKLKPKNKPLEAKYYYEWMFGEYTKKEILHRLKIFDNNLYSSEVKFNKTPDEVYNEVKNVVEVLSKELEKTEFISLTKILDKLGIIYTR